MVDAVSGQGYQFRNVDVGTVFAPNLDPEKGSQKINWGSTNPAKTKAIEAKLEKFLNKSKLDDRCPSETYLKRNGFKESEYMDMNGGKHYFNDKGESIRLAGWHGEHIAGPEDSKCVSYTSADKKLQHEVVYDPDGNPMKGWMQVETENGSIEQYEYEYDLDGKIHVTSLQVAEIDISIPCHLQSEI